MTLALPFTVGRLRCWALDAGDQALDGGAMFGVVPKPLWEKRIPADARNRIPLVMRSILIDHPDGLTLIETGIGDKDDAKFRDIYGIRNAGHPGPTRLEDAIRDAGYASADVRHVFNTHLHFDHAGGNTLRDPEGGEGAVRLAFPNARYYVQRNELEFARTPNERTRASYLPPNYDPVAAAGRFTLLEGDREVLPGVSVRLTPGHTPWHQAVLIRDGGETAAYLGDLIPTSAHLPIAWTMGYDLEPLRVLTSRKAILADAVRERWRIVFDHDASVVWGFAVQGPKAAELADVQAHLPTRTD